MQETSSGSDNVAAAFASTTEQITTATSSIALERWLDEDNGLLYAYGAISQAEVERRFRSAWRMRWLPRGFMRAHAKPSIGTIPTRHSTAV
jgi:hypothetical protein